MANNSNKSRKKNSVRIARRANHNGEFLQKLRNHLKVLFQFDCADLDFGIYRIMNYKRKEIERFIEDDLIRVVEKEFEKYKVQNQKELSERIEEKKKEIRKLEKELGEKILKLVPAEAGNGEIEEKFRDKPFAKEYLELKKQIDEIDVTENIQSQVFNDLYNFFSRYYEDGDFISKKRYSSKQNKYAIPYSGEEVKLYWANFDQYYIKTGEVFKDYEFNLKGWKFVFRTALADVEPGNVKGNRRYFFLSSDEPVKLVLSETEELNKTCLIKFEYRMLTNGDLRQYPVKTKEGKAKTTGITQDELNPILKDKILTFITPLEPKAILTETQDEKTIIEKHLYKYTRKITSDFFIHKNLKSFLERELDYFIKTEVLDIESFDTEKERYFDRHITRSKVVKNIGERIIEFLSQIEDYQKMLWEKKKFVLKTDYVITIDRIPEDLDKEILENKEQLKEWQELGFDIPSSVSFLRKQKSKLPVDTKYFSEDFKEKLLEKLSEKGNLDDLLDGVLIKSENWQALNLLQEKYKEKVQCIYIDPPYNTQTTDFLYKNNYKHSSWITMMHNRLVLSENLLKSDGKILTSINDYELSNILKIKDNIFSNDNFIGILTISLPPKTDEKFYATNHEYLIIYAKDKNFSDINNFKKENFTKTKKEVKEKFMRGSSHSLKSDRPNMFYPIYYNSLTRKIELKKSNEAVEILPIDDRGWERVWRWGKDRFLNNLNKIIIEENKGKYIVYIKLLKEEKEEYKPKTIWNKSKYLSNLGTMLLNNMFNSPNIFNFSKSLGLMEDIIYINSNLNSFILDFFAGSGPTAHAVMKLNKEDGGKRKFILVEMADYFDTVIIPRLKKLCYSFNWEDGKPQDTDGISQSFKYHYLEQYEDSLHNIEFLQEEKGQKLLQLLPEEAKSEYLMKYMLKFETEGSPSLLNLQQFDSPFEYKLRVLSLPDTLTLNGVKGLKGEIASPSARNDKKKASNDNIVDVDLVETFNYLVGLKVNKYKFLKENGRKYVFVFGERNNRKTAIVWRATKDIDMAKDKEVIDKNLTDYNPDEIFINGDSFVKGYKPIESEFKVLMEG